MEKGDQTRKNYKRRWISASRSLFNKNSALYTNQDSSDDEAYGNVNVACKNADEDTSQLPGDLEATSHITQHSDSCDELGAVQHQALEMFDDISWLSSESSYSDAEDRNDTILVEQLTTWANEFSIKHNALDKLLTILKKSGHVLPSTARSLLKTVRDVAVTSVSGLDYAYIGIENQLIKLVTNMSNVAVEIWLCHLHILSD